MITQEPQVKDAGITGRKNTLKLTKYMLYGILNSAKRQLGMNIILINRPGRCNT